MEVPRMHARERWGSKEGVDQRQADLVLELWEERSHEQELLEQAQEQGEGRKGPCGSIRGGRASSLHGKCMRPQSRFQIHGGGGNQRQRRTRERAPAGRSKGGTSWEANSTRGGASVRSDRQEEQATRAPAMNPQHRGNKPYD